MHFSLIDHIIELDEDRIVAIKNVSSSEEYLKDHFPTFPVLPGVLMIEALVQAARAILRERSDTTADRYVLSSVKALKYGSFVRPGETLQVEVSVARAEDDGSFLFKGVGKRISPDAPPNHEHPTTVSGRFTLRPVRFPQRPARITEQTPNVSRSLA